MEYIANLSVGDILGRITILLVAISFVIQIAPVKLNPWSWIARKIGKAINHEIVDKIDEIGNNVKDLRCTVDHNAAKLARNKILEFGDDLIFQPERKHSKDRFDDVMQYITEYDAYCAEHPEFKNHITASTTKIIVNTYEKCMQDHSFL